MCEEVGETECAGESWERERMESWRERKIMNSEREGGSIWRKGRKTQSLRKSEREWREEVTENGKQPHSRRGEREE